MKHLKDFNRFYESINNNELLDDINEIFEYHSYYLSGIEFELTEDYINEILVEIKESDFKKSKDKNSESIANIYNLLLKYKNWKFINSTNWKLNYKSDFDSKEFIIDIIDNEGNLYKGIGNSYPAGSPILKHIEYPSKKESVETEIVFKGKRNPNLVIMVKKGTDGRIAAIVNKSGIRFPFQVGQLLQRNIETWACNNNFYMDGKDTCPEKKIFGVKAKDVPQGHEWRTVFPNKFR